MPIFEKPPLETLTPAKDRWTPIYLEHGRLEVDDSSIKWIGADRLVYRLPVATLSAVLLGPGTTVTHAAMKACADSNTPVCWIGEDGMRFYAFGITPNHDNTDAAPARCRSGPTRRSAPRSPAACFVQRFPGVDVQAYSVTELRGMEGLRVRAKYAELGQQYGVTWKGRNYDKSNWNLADNINRALSAANASLYAVVRRRAAARSVTCRRWDSSTTAARCRSSTMWPTCTRKSPSFPGGVPGHAPSSPTTRANWSARCSRSASSRKGCSREFRKDMEELFA